jgi:hypothetical protein
MAVLYLQTLALIAVALSVLMTVVLRANGGSPG